MVAADGVEDGIDVSEGGCGADKWLQSQRGGMRVSDSLGKL
jgi:hypothetical protein